MSQDNGKDKKEQKTQLENRIRVNMEEEALSLFQSETRARTKLEGGPGRVVFLSVALMVLFLLSICFVPYGAASNLLGANGMFTYTPAIYRDVVITRVSQLAAFFTGRAEGGTVQFVFYTYLAVTLGGMALAAAGAAFQGVFQNPMAEPTTLGVQAGGVLAGVIYLLFFSSMAEGETEYYFEAVQGSELLTWWSQTNIFARAGQQLFILAGCFLGVMLTVGVATLIGRGKLNTVALILAGSIFTMLVNQITTLIQYVVTDSNINDVRIAGLNSAQGGGGDTRTQINQLIGGVFSAGYAWYDILLMGVPIVICLILVFSMGKTLNVMVFGADEAASMGVNVTRSRNILIVLCTVLSAVTLAFCGQVNLLGLMIPHFARYVTGPDFRYLTPVSALLGGITTVLIYDVCYLTAQIERFTMYTSVICALMSLYFILRYRRNRHADWA